MHKKSKRKSKIIQLKSIKNLRKNNLIKGIPYEKI